MLCYVIGVFNVGNTASQVARNEDPGWAVHVWLRINHRLVAEVERGGGGEADLYDLRQEDAGGFARRRTRTRNVDAGGDAGAGRVAVLQGRGGDAVRRPADGAAA